MNIPPFLQYILSPQFTNQLLLLLLPLVLVAFWFKHLFLDFVRVKVGRGKYILIVLHCKTRTIFKTGWLDESKAVLYRDSFRKKKIEPHRIVIPANINPFFELGTVKAVNVDEEKQALMSPNLDGIQTFDSKYFDTVLEREMSKPEIEDAKKKQQEKLKTLAILVGAGASVVAAFLAFQCLKALGG